MESGMSRSTLKSAKGGAASFMAMRPLPDGQAMRRRSCFDAFRERFRGWETVHLRDIESESSKIAFILKSHEAKSNSCLEGMSSNARPVSTKTGPLASFRSRLSVSPSPIAATMRVEYILPSRRRQARRYIVARRTNIVLARTSFHPSPLKRVKSVSSFCHSAISPAACLSTARTRDNSSALRSLERMIPPSELRYDDSWQSSNIRINAEISAFASAASPEMPHSAKSGRKTDRKTHKNNPLSMTVTFNDVRLGRHHIQIESQFGLPANSVDYW